jgi:hypothetical protein
VRSARTVGGKTGHWLHDGLDMLFVLKFMSPICRVVSIVGDTDWECLVWFSRNRFPIS